MSDLRYPINSIVMAYDGRIGIVRAHYFYAPPASVTSVEAGWRTIIECHHRVWHYRSSQLTGMVTYPDTPPIRVIDGGRERLTPAQDFLACAKARLVPAGQRAMQPNSDPHNPGPEAA
ncbi:hypothetical protein [Oceanibaculum indicum]|uniref:Uncharacterized protein n=1 Tax=Oceanibaculum indicum TaxID=526216 RepID=A0A420WGN6_9PROT|nr:hypothetical protein [Oceanibaculum indicum]RKQ70160.1 hypothetical protein BCL74_2100 [Oceanibaculum indicum]